MAFYLVPPGGNISLQKLEAFAEARFCFLSQVLNTGGDRVKLHDIVNNISNVLESECLIAGTVKDRISHFFLRLCFCDDFDTMDFLFRAETLLFDFQVSCMTEIELIKIFQSLDKHLLEFQNHKITLPSPGRDIVKAFLCMKSEGNGWKQLVHKYLQGQDDCFMRVPFQTVPKFVSERLVFLQKGWAYFPYSKLRELTTSLFSNLLHLGASVARQRRHVVSKDDRLRSISSKLKFLYRRRYGYQPTLSGSPRSLTHDEVDRVTSLFPPCMAHLHQKLKEHHRLRHHSRIQYTLFLKEIGMPVHEALMFWRKEYSHETSKNGCSHTWSSNEKRYTYNIRHLYGLEGSRINYRGHCCSSLQSAGMGPGEDGGCPFKNFDADHLTTLLETGGISEGVEEILSLANKEDYTGACHMVLVDKIKKDLRSKQVWMKCEEKVQQTDEEESKSQFKHQKVSTNLLQTSDISQCPKNLINSFLKGDNSDICCKCVSCGQGMGGNSHQDREDKSNSCGKASIIINEKMFQVKQAKGNDEVLEACNKQNHCCLKNGNHLHSYDEPFITSKEIIHDFINMDNATREHFAKKDMNQDDSGIVDTSSRSKRPKFDNDNVLFWKEGENKMCCTVEQRNSQCIGTREDNSGRNKSVSFPDAGKIQRPVDFYLGYRKFIDSLRDAVT
ncbi:hypothetical protein CHS0354_009447 [Potamilus streckersoni]|uniref:DNA primase large subunit C-terminal domain-containing protein n=1 Tax=Potamilus streckersoni TaxID=2493646 RepID=A0AAE0TIU5_9BIVA|nr:hypothetical protein CHS0354_009447 [Potamilus streckersoni]